MKRMAGLTTLLALLVALAFALTVHGCGGSNDQRDRERCEACNPEQIDRDCLDQCTPFCVPGDPDCTSRCNRECDRCKAELECRACVGNCTGTTDRCAPVGAALVCEDGTF